jgi:hypothetical protein
MDAAQALEDAEVGSKDSGRVSPSTDTTKSSSAAPSRPSGVTTRDPSERRPSAKAAASGGGAGHRKVSRPVLPTRKTFTAQPLAPSTANDELRFKHAPLKGPHSSTKRARYQIASGVKAADPENSSKERQPIPPKAKNGKKRKYDINSDGAVGLVPILPKPACETVTPEPTSTSKGLTPFKKKKLEEEKELNQSHTLAQQAALLAHQIISSPHVAKQLLLTMALVRINPRAAPETWPKPGSVIEEGFFWGTYPPLEMVLRAHMSEYSINVMFCVANRLLTRLFTLLYHQCRNLL